MSKTCAVVNLRMPARYAQAVGINHDKLGFHTYIHNKAKSMISELVLHDEDKVKYKNKVYDLNKYRGIKVPGGQTEIDIYPILVRYIFRNSDMLSMVYAILGKDIRREFGLNKGETMQEVVERYLKIQSEGVDIGFNNELKISNRLNSLRSFPIDRNCFEDKESQINSLLAFMMPDLIGYNFYRTAVMVLNIIRISNQIVSKVGNINKIITPTNQETTEQKKKFKPMHYHVDDLAEADNFVVNYWAYKVLKDFGIELEILLKSGYTFTEKEFRGYFTRKSPYKKFYYGVYSSTELEKAVYKRYYTALTIIGRQIWFMMYNNSPSRVHKCRIGITDFHYNTYTYTLAGFMQMLSLVDTYSGINVVKAVGDHAKSKEILSELDKLRNDIESKDDVINKNKITINGLRDELEKSKETIKKLSKSDSTVLERTNKKLESEVERLKKEADKFKNESAELNKKLGLKVKECSNLIKDNKKLEAENIKFKESIEALGDSGAGETAGSEAEVENSVSLDEKVAFLKNYTILLCGGYGSMKSTLVNTYGLDIRHIANNDWSDGESQFDICVIIAIRCAHKMVNYCKSRAKTLNADVIYSSNTNPEILIDELYRYYNH